MIPAQHIAEGRKRNFVVFLLFFLVTLSSYNLDIGFSLKPYMIFLGGLFFLHVSTFTVCKLYMYEVLLLIFYVVYSYSGSFSRYPGASLLISLGVLLILSCYFIMRYVLLQSSILNIQQAIIKAGLLFNLLSLILYVIGIGQLQFTFTDSEMLSHGVLVDRGYPRLIGVLSDPNVYVFYNTLFFSFFLCYNASFLGRLGLIFATLTNLLTFSRGGLLAMVCIVVVYMILQGSLKRLFSVFGMLLLIGSVMYVAAYLMKMDMLHILQQRIHDFQQDGGSGRFTLWERSLHYFIEHPVIGIGAFNFAEYNAFYYGERLYVHNTYLELLSETGVIGFSLYMLFLIGVVKKTLKPSLLQKHPFLFLTFIGFLLQMLSLSLVLNEAFFLYLAVLASYLRLQTEEEYGDAH